MFRILACLLFLTASTVNADLLWQFNADGMIAGNPVVRGDSVYVTGGSRLYVLDREGELRWSYDAGAGSRSTVELAGDVVYLLADNGLHAVDGSGRRLWLFESPDGPFEVEGKTMGWGEGLHIDPWAWYRSAPRVVGEKILFGNRHGTWAVDARSGKPVWHASTGTTHTRPAFQDGIVVVGSWDNHLYGLNIADGSVVWKVAARLPGGEMAGWLGWEGFNLDPVVHEGVVYVGSRGTHFYAINAETGVEKWSWKHPSSWLGSPAVVSNGVVYFGLSDGSSLTGLETRMGNQSLLFRNRFYNFARPQANTDRVFMASLSGELFAVDKATGHGRRIFATAGSRKNLAALQSPNGGLKYLFSAEGYTHENATRDVNRMLSMLDSLLSLTLDGDTLYAGSANGKLYAISVE